MEVVVEILEQMRALFGPDGEHWVNRAPCEPGEHCLVSAFEVAVNRVIPDSLKLPSFHVTETMRILRHQAGLRGRTFISKWNDEQTFSRIDKLLSDSISEAKLSEAA